MRMLCTLARPIAVLALMPALWTAPVAAQKAKDTVRIGVHQPIAIVDGVYDPQPQTNLMDRMVFDTLIEFDSDQRKLVPNLAKAWKQLDPTTYEFQLRDDVKFHDGSAFDADDVVYTIGFVTDPKVTFRLKDNRYGQFAGVEKVDRYTVRIRTKAPFAAFLSRLATILPIYPSDLHAKLADKSKFGRAPVGTGPYKAVQVDSSKGVILERNADYRHGTSAKPAAKIARVVVLPLPDEQTRLARLMVGEIDMMYDVSRDVAESLKQAPNIEISVRPSISFTYLMLDAADRSKIGVLKDKRVREAVMRAIDRAAIVKALQPAEIAAMPAQQAMCHPWHIGCAFSEAPPAFDLAKSKALLAEAGQASGFALQISTWGVARPVAEAVAGQLRRVGIKATIDNLTVGSFVKKRASGQLSAYIVLWDNGGGAADVESTAAFFFLPGSRNYSADKELAELVQKGRVELDAGKREAIYKRMFDKVNVERYAMPVMPLASVIAHSKELAIPTGGTKKPEGFMFNLLAWK